MLGSKFGKVVSSQITPGMHNEKFVLSPNARKSGSSL